MGASHSAPEPGSHIRSLPWRTQAPSLVTPFGLPFPPQSSARPKAGALVSATGMDTSAPWQQREGKLPWAPGPPTASSRLHSEKSLSGQKQGRGAGEAGAPGEWFPGFLLPRDAGEEGRGRPGWGSPFSTSVPTMPCLQQRPGWLGGLPRRVWGHAPQHSWAGEGGLAWGLHAKLLGPAPVRARKGRAFDNPVLRKPQSCLESPGPVHIGFVHKHAVGQQVRVPAGSFHSRFL